MKKLLLHKETLSLVRYVNNNCTYPSHSVVTNLPCPSVNNMACQFQAVCQ